MLISTWVISGVFILVQSALCLDVKDASEANGKISEQVQVATETYRYNHPPPLEATQHKGSRREKSVNINEESSSNRSRLRSLRRRNNAKASTRSDLEIPVQVIYDSETTTPKINVQQTTISPATRTTRKLFVQRRPIKANNNKKIDIRQTTSYQNTSELSITDKIPIPTETQNSTSTSTEFPKRSRGSYFKKRTGPPPPKVKILEEKNFVFSHSGNFHYSFLGGDGTKVSSRGELKSFDNDKTGEAVSGSVFYKDKDGQDFSLTYTADENGYRPIGAHLPTPPPLPPAIARALKYIADKTSTATPLEQNDQ